LSHVILLLFQGFITSRREVALDHRAVKRFLTIELRKCLLNKSRPYRSLLLVGLVDVG